MSTIATRQADRPAAGPPPALLLLSKAGSLAVSAYLAEPVRELFGRLESLLGVFVKLPDALAAASDEEVIRLLCERHAEIDLALHQSLESQLRPALAAAVTADPRLGPVVPTLLEILERLRQRAVGVLAGRGLERIEVTPGRPIGDDAVVPSGQPGVVTRERALDGRIACVLPGNGGYRLHGRVIVPAIAEVYAWREPATSVTA